jgi:hypothetical protein
MQRNMPLQRNMYHSSFSIQNLEGETLNGGFGASLYGVSAIIEYVCPKEFLQFSERCLGKLGTSIGTWTF